MPATFALSDEAELPPSSSPNGSVMLGECETHRYSVSTLDLYRKNLRHLGDYEIVSYLVDTGAQTTISKPGVLYLMLRQQKSSLAFSGFHGNARTYSLMRGEFDGYVLSDTPGEMGSKITISSECVDGVNHHLLSMTQKYSLEGYNFAFQHGADFSGMYRVCSTTGKWIDKIPFRRDDENEQWFLDVVIAKDKATAVKIGETIMNSMHRDNEFTRAISDAMSVCNSTITIGAVIRVLGGPVSISDEATDTCLFISESEINQVTSQWIIDEDRPVFSVPRATVQHIFNQNRSDVSLGEWCHNASGDNGTKRQKFPLTNPVPYEVCPDETDEYLQRLIDIDINELTKDWYIEQAAKRTADIHATRVEKHDCDSDQYDDTKDPNGTNPAGTRNGLSSKSKKMTEWDWHVATGHLGHYPGCQICIQLKKHLRRVYKTIVPYHDPRPGFTWPMDIIYWSEMSIDGYWYTLCMRDNCTGVLWTINLTTRDEVTEAFKALILAKRADPDYQHFSYPVCSAVEFDQAGEFTCVEFGAVLRELGIQDRMKDNSRKEDNARAEYGVRQLETITKALMLSTTLPTAYWSYAVNTGAHLKSLMPLTKNVISRDGDAVKPLQQLTNGAISNRECGKMLEATIIPGTLCLIEDKKTKASDIGNFSRSVWAVALEPHVGSGRLTVFENLITGKQWTTRSFVTFTQQSGQNAWTTLGLPLPAMSKAMLKRKAPKDHPMKNLVQVPFFPTPVQPNTVLDKVTMPNQGGAGCRVWVINPDNGLCVTDPETGELHSTKQKLEPSAADVLRQMDIISNPTVDVDSVEFKISKLDSDPASFYGKDVYRFFPEADPPGVYRGTVITMHSEEDRSDDLYQIDWPATGNNIHASCDFDRDDMTNYCIRKIDGEEAINDAKSEGTPTIARSEGTLAAVKSEGTAAAVNSEGTTLEVHKQLFVKDFAAYTCAQGETFATVLRKMKIKDNEKTRVYQWWQRHFGLGHVRNQHPEAVYFANPFQKGRPNKKKVYIHFSKGTQFPRPQGETWSALQREHENKANLDNQQYLDSALQANILNSVCEKQRMEAKDEDSEEAAIHCLIEEIAKEEAWTGEFEELLGLCDTRDSGNISMVLSALAGTTKAREVLSALNKISAETSETEIEKKPNTEDPKGTLQELIQEHVADSKYLDSIGHIIPPETVEEARGRSDWPLWEWAIDQELEAFIRLKVHSRKMTLGECREAGHQQSPVKSHMIFSFKYNKKTGDPEKPKARYVLAGTKHNMKFGEHYWFSFAPAPDPASARLLQIICCALGWTRAAFDVDTAFLWSVLDEREQVPVKLPKGMEVVIGGVVYDHVILLRGQYGSPSAGAHWTFTRDQFILEAFDESRGGLPGFSVTQMIQDPCMFRILGPVDDDNHRSTSILLMHVDDGDIVSESAKQSAIIMDKFDQRFSITLSDPESMLGVTRTMTTDDQGIRYVEFTLERYIEDVFEEWKPIMSERECPMDKKAPKYPFPNKHFSVVGTTGDHGVPKPSPEEMAEIADFFMQIVGQLMWIARMALPELMTGCSFLCRVLSTPSYEAFDAALFMLSYAYSQKHRGMRARSDGNQKLMALYDASNLGDEKDSRSQAGFCCMLFDCCFAYGSGKNRLCGLSSTHNEYMALVTCVKSIVHSKNLLTEMGFEQFCDEPVPTIGDNIQCVTLCHENKVTSGNKFYTLDLHYSKEMYIGGIICPRWIGTDENWADIMTKAVCGAKTKTLRPKFTGYGDKPLEDPPPPALNRTKCVPFQKYRVESSHGASTSATVDVHDDRPHGRWGFTPKWMSEWCG